MNIIETTQLLHFITENPFLSFLTVLVITYIPIQSLLVGWARLLRHLNVRKHGWPPSHCDADGDPVATDTDAE
jgi:hypothetical protein